jgi:hypothetical protein
MPRRCWGRATAAWCSGSKLIKGSMVPEAEFTSYYGRPILKRACPEAVHPG